MLATFQIPVPAAEAFFHLRKNKNAKYLFKTSMIYFTVYYILLNFSMIYYDIFLLVLVMRLCQVLVLAFSYSTVFKI